MWAGIELASNNLAFSFSTMILIVLITGTIIFYAKDFKLGIIMGMLISFACFVWFYSAGYNYHIPFIIFIIHGILLTFTIYFMGKAADAGVI